MRITGLTRWHHFARARSWYAAVGLAAAGALSACDNNLGVTHISRYNGLPDYMCIQQVLHDIPGISIQNHETIEQEHVSMHAWTYQSGSDQYQLMVGPFVYNQMGVSGDFLSGRDAGPRLRQMLAQVDGKLELTCKMHDLRKHMREMCLNPSGGNGDCPPQHS